MDRIRNNIHLQPHFLQSCGNYIAALFRRHQVQAEFSVEGVKEGLGVDLHRCCCGSWSSKTKHLAKHCEVPFLLCSFPSLAFHRRVLVSLHCLIVGTSVDSFTWQETFS